MEKGDVGMPADGRRTVYITGIGGNIGRTLVEGLKDRYRLRGCNLDPVELEGAQVQQGDIRDAAFMRRELEGVDTLIHLAANPSIWAEWDSVLTTNIDGTYQVYEAARQAGVRRIIFASTNHVTGILTEKAVDMDPTVPIRPDCLYGVSKAFGEALGRFYSDRYGLSVLNYRIGWFPEPKEPREVVEFYRHRQDAYPLMWLSVRDAIHAFQCGIEADPELKFGIYYIMSRNRDMLWDMSNAEKELGYRPQDDLGALFDQFGVPYNFRIPREGLGG